MTAPSIGSRFTTLALLALLAPAFAFAWRGPLSERDEAIHAEVAREILTTGNWVTLHFGKDAWFDKPPLVFWMSAASMKILGVSEGAARLPVALCGALLTLTVWALSRAMYSEEAAMMAAVIASSAPLVAGCTGLLLMDIPLTLFLTLTLALFYLSTDTQSTGRVVLLSVGAGIAMGLGVLTKGPVAIAVAGLAALLAMCLRSDLRPKWIGALPAAMAVCLLVALPWYLMAFRQNGAPFVDAFILYHNVGRFLRPEHHRGASALLYVAVIVAGFIPWTSVLFSGVLNALTRRAREDVLLLVWSFVVLAFFGLAKTKLAAYILPGFPSLAILTAPWLACPPHRRAHRIAVQLGGGLLLITLAVAACVALRGADAVVALAWLGVGSVAIVLIGNEATQMRLRAVVLTGCLLALMLHGVVLPRVREQTSLRGAVLAATRLNGPLKIYGSTMPGSALFYSKGSAALLTSASLVRPGDVLLMHTADLPLPLPGRVCWRGGKWCLYNVKPAR